MKYLYIITTAITAVVLGISSRRAMAQPVSCSPGYMENPQNRRICNALMSLFHPPGSPLEAYPDEIGPNIAYGLPVGYKGRISPSEFLENNLPFVDRGTKRQDVDHVFLRFGRRR